MTKPYDTHRATRLTRRVAAMLASALITFTLFHEVAMPGAPDPSTAAAGTQLAQASTPAKTH